MKARGNYLIQNTGDLKFQLSQYSECFRRVKIFQQQLGLPHKYYLEKEQALINTLFQLCLFPLSSTSFLSPRIQSLQNRISFLLKEFTLYFHSH